MATSNGNRPGRVVLLVLAAISAALVAVLMAPFIEPVMFAMILAITFEPLYGSVEQRIRKPWLSSLVFVLLILGLVLTPLALVGVTVAKEAKGVYRYLADHSAQEGGWGSYVSNQLDKPVAWIAEKTGLETPNIRAAIVERAQWVSTRLVGWSGSLLGNLTATVANGFLALFILFFLFVERNRIQEGLYEFMPLPRNRTAELIRTVKDSIVANVYGIVAVGSAQGLLTGIGFAIAGLPSPVLWGTIAAFCSLIPIVGPALVWAPAALGLLIQGFWGKALFLGLWGVLVVGMIDNILRPLILAGRTELNTLVVFFAVMGGMQAFGFIGIFAGPVIFSLAIAVFRLLREEFGQPELS